MFYYIGRVLQRVWDKLKVAGDQLSKWWDELDTQVPERPTKVDTVELPKEEDGGEAKF